MLHWIRFLDGPARKTFLTLERVPLFLRVTFGCSNPAMAPKWDALDQLEDEPGPEEEIHVYRRHGELGTVHVDTTEKGRRVGRWYRLAEYRLHPVQPDDATVRNTVAWRNWCQAEWAKTLKEQSTCG